jgi:TRAP-type transport system periplasmic protein
MKNLRIKKWVPMIAGVIVFLFVMVSISSAQTKLRYSGMFPSTHPFSQVSMDWCKEVEKRTEGRVKVSFFPAGTLTPPMQAYDSVVRGIADIGEGLLAWAPGRLPLSEVFNLPLGYTGAYQATKLANDFLKKFKPKEFDEVKVIWIAGGAAATLSTKKVLSSTKEIKGLRLITNAQTSAIVTALGAAPVTIPFTEAYDALQKGLADGCLLNVESQKAYKLAEVIKTIFQIDAIQYSGNVFVVMNKNKFNSLSVADRQTIDKINEEFVEKMAKVWQERNKECTDFAREKGVKFVKATKEEEAEIAANMKPLFDKYVKDKGAMGLPAKEALDWSLEYVKKHP